MRRHLSFSHSLRAALASGAFLVAFNAPVEAGEGGGSAYLQGTFNDFAAAVFGPPGFYLRNDLYYYEGDIGARPLGGRVAADAEQELWLNLLKLAYLSDTELWGARVGYAITIPYADVDVGASATVPAVGADAFRSGGETGFGDIYINPLMLSWVRGNNHFKFAPGIVVPTGKYDEDKLVNIGRNYWALDVAGSYTYLNPETGREFSATAGVYFNDENPDTNYTTGNEFHLDWNITQYFSESFGVGFAGYWYEQISDDKGTLAGGLTAQDDFDGFRGSGWGLGPSFVYNTQVGDRTVSVIGKALFDIDSKNRFEGDIYMLSAAFQF